MRGKEGDVYNRIVELEYIESWRAYERGSQKVMVHEKTGLCVIAERDLQLIEWHALRAYQDEQRKKGEPIKPNECKPMRRDYGLPDVTFQYYPCPDYPNDPPQVNLFNPGTVWAHAKFTNFRWRPGHGPKETLNQSI
jgi:hypothetical protein